ncbi:unnamed protein product [Oncorhynchus mykiss]|uniref:Protein kinase domain-containing protein n=1 Tax=Oncorhynchus mykiss TaxID=8022 RepID=A0A060ZC76_ONCMY|nr:unnamed protein product [Oncorhynchus mykiss]
MLGSVALSLCISLLLALLAGFCWIWKDYHVDRPLFSELKFHLRETKPENMLMLKGSKKLDFLGIPANWGSGLAEHNRTRYRFMAMDRLGSDLSKVCERNGDKLKKHTVLQLGCVLLDVLEYIHDNEYVHADVKKANLMLDHTDPNKVQPRWSAQGEQGKPKEGTQRNRRVHQHRCSKWSW